jgi:23S rRNA (pseudouridine1915-N3)-methyltransferase
VRITLICVGRLKSGPERELFDRYFARLRGMARSVGVADVEVREIDESRARRPEDRRE